MRTLTRIERFKRFKKGFEKDHKGEWEFDCKPISKILSNDERTYFVEYPCGYKNTVYNREINEYDKLKDSYCTGCFWTRMRIEDEKYAGYKEKQMEMLTKNLEEQIEYQKFKRELEVEGYTRSFLIMIFGSLVILSPQIYKLFVN